MFVAGTFAGTLGLDAAAMTAAGPQDSFVARFDPVPTHPPHAPGERGPVGREQR